MNGGGFKPSLAARIAAFIKRSRQNTAVRRITNVMAVFVVFITTYMMILPAITLESDPGNAISQDDIEIDITGASYENAEYNGISYTADLTVTFSVLVSEVLDAGNSYNLYYELPEYITPPSSYVAGTVMEDEEGHFTYYYQQDVNGNWYIYIMLDEDYVATISGEGDETITGYFSFYATIGSGAVDTDGNINIKFSDDITLTIQASDIEKPNYTDGSNDIYVTKSASSYNATGNYIDYTVTVSTLLGTGDSITLSDILSNLDSVGVKTIEVQSVTYDTLDANGNASGSGTAVTEGSNGYTFTYTAGDETFTMTLPALSGSNTTNTKAECGSEYVIVYRVYLDELSGNVYTNAKNGVTVESGDINNSASAGSVTVSHSTLSKYGSLSSDGTYITWTITVNASQQDITGYTLADNMFADAPDEIAITSSSDDTNYTEQKDTNGKTTAIVFNADAGSGTNTATYTITYTTAVSTELGGGVTVQNNATLDDGGSTETAAGSVWVAAHGSVDKEVQSGTYDSSTDTYTVVWTYTVKVPESGISAGTVIYDYLGDEWSYQTSSTSQYFTYVQISQVDSFDYVNVYSSDTGSSVGSMQLLNGTGYTVEVYDITAAEWVDFTTVRNNSGGSYADHLFTAFRITFNEDVSFVESENPVETWFKFTYSTTLDASSLSSGTASSLTTTNKAIIDNAGADLTDSASYTAYAKVTKTDGYGNTGSTNITTSDGALTWKVRISVPDTATALDDSFVVTDTLPVGVTLESLYLYSSADSSYQLNLVAGTTNTYSIELNGTTIMAAVEEKTKTVTTTDSGGNEVTTTQTYQVVTMTIPASWYSTYAGSIFWITYVCASESTSNTVETISYTNEISVNLGSDGYGSSSQTQNVTYQKSNMSKSGTYDKANQQVDYALVINPDAADLVDGLDSLTLTDTLSAFMNDEYGQYFALQQSSVKFYYLYKITDDGQGNYTYTYPVTDGQGNTTEETGTVSSLTDANVYTYTDGSGNTVYYYKIEADDISWTYEGTNLSSGTNTYTITAEVPDGVAILMEYSYKAYALNKGDIPKTEADSVEVSNLTNTASLQGGTAGKTSSSSTFSYYDAGFAAGLTGLTIYKVDSDNYGQTLAGAEFAVYKYTKNVNGEGEWVYVTTLTTGSNGSLTINKSAIGDTNFTYNTAYYIVETKAPGGYVLDNTTHVHFYWSNTDTATYPECYPDGFTANTMSDGQVYDLTFFTQDIYFENAKTPEDTVTSVTVEKEWVDSSGNAITADLPSSILLTLYKYEESDVAGSAGGGASAAETVNVHFMYGSDIWNSPVTVKTEAVEKGEDFTLSIDAGDGYTISYYSLYTYAAYTYSEISGYSSWSSPGQTLSLTVDDSVVTQDVYVLYYTSAQDSSICGTVSVGSGGGTSLSGVTASLLPKNDSGEYAGVAYDTYTLAETNNWSLTIDGLPYEVYDANGELHTYYYYFVEDAMDGYYTTYSSSEGVTNGGTITITNTQIPTTDITVMKKWYDSGGAEITDPTNLTLYDSNGNVISNVSDMSITVNLYRTTAEEDSGTGTAGGGTATNTVTVTIALSSNISTILATEDVPEGAKVMLTIELPAYNGVYVYDSNWGTVSSWYNSSGTAVSETITIIDEATADVTYYLSDSLNVTITYEGGSSSPSLPAATASYTGSELPTDGELIGTYTITPTHDTETDTWIWSYTVKDLPTIGVADDGSTVTYAYYFREDTVRGYTATYDSDGSTDGTITISNTASEQYYTKAKVEKKWNDSSGNEITDLDSYTATFQLWQALYDETNNTYVTDSNGSYVLTAYGSPVTLSGSNTTDWANTWTNLPTTATYNSETYTCVYFLTETSASDGGTATFTVSYGASTEATGGAAGAVSENLVVYDTDNTTVLATYYFVTYGNTTGDSTNPAAPATVVVTNTSSETKTQTIEFTVAKTFVKDSASYAPTANTTVTFTLLQVLTYVDGGTETVYDTNVSTNITYEKTVTFDGSATSANVSWSDLPATLDVDISGATTTCDCTYYIVETKVTNANSVDITSQYTAGYTVGTATPNTYTVTDAGSGANVTYYKVSDGETLTVTNTQESVILPMTGGLGADRMSVFLGCGLALLAVCIFFVRRRILCGGGDCET